MSSLRPPGRPHEARLWAILRDRRLDGYKFRRQHPIGRFVAGFACPTAQLILELNGHSHNTRFEQDAARDEFLQQNGWRTLRIPNADLMRNGNSVVLSVLSHLES